MERLVREEGRVGCHRGRSVGRVAEGLSECGEAEAGVERRRGRRLALVAVGEVVGLARCPNVRVAMSLVL